MPTHPVQLSTRPVSLLLVAAFAALALYMFQPWSHVRSASPNDASDAGVPSTLQTDGKAQATAQGGIVRTLVVPIALHGQDAISLDGAVLRAETEMSPTAAAAVPASYSLRWLDGNGDRVIDPGEHVVLTANLPDKTSVYPQNPLALVFRTADGGTLRIENVLP
jgi:hypothetical protein